MRAWPRPDVPELSALGLGRGSAPSVLDVASRERVRLDPSGPARMYVCGITPYDATHLGHAATYLAFDLLERVWLDHGTPVRYIQNVTDVDDPLLERAAETGMDWRELAEQETDLFRRDMTALGVLPPAEYLGAVETIDLVVDLVEELRERGAVYDVDGDLYFSVHSDPTFGQVSGLSRDTMESLFAERGGDPERPGKRDALDCLVWQAERPDQPSWPSRLGAGRPGWHVECASMALRRLGTGFDVQGGGSDLAFPHHEMSASEAQVARDGERFARTYVHAGMVGYDAAKMSKSKGNLVLVSSLREAGHDPMAIRIALLGHHYGSDWEWTPQDLTAAEARLARWRDALQADRPADVRPLVDGIRSALSDDLDAPRALAAVDGWAEATLGGYADAGEDAKSVRAVLTSLLGLDL